MECLRWIGKVPVDRETLTMVVMVGRMVADIYLKCYLEIGLRSHCSVGEVCTISDISSIVAGWKDQKVLQV